MFILAAYHTGETHLNGRKINMEMQFTNELNQELLDAINASPFTAEQLAEMDESARAHVRPRYPPHPELTPTLPFRDRW